MSHLVRMTEAGALGLHAMAILAERAAVDEGRPTTTQEVAALLRASSAHLSKVLQRLAGCALVTSVRGPGGGFRLARPAGEITLLDIYEAIEGAMSTTGCLFSERICGRQSCIMGGWIARANGEIRRYLSETHLASLVEGSPWGEPDIRKEA